MDNYFVRESEVMDIVYDLDKDKFSLALLRCVLEQDTFILA